MLCNDSIRPERHQLWNRQSDLLGGFEIYHKLKLHRLLDQNVSELYFVGFLGAHVVRNFDQIQVRVAEID